MLDQWLLGSSVVAQTSLQAAKSGKPASAAAAVQDVPDDDVPVVVPVEPASRNRPR